MHLALKRRSAWHELGVYSGSGRDGPVLFVRMFQHSELACETLTAEWTVELRLLPALVLDMPPEGGALRVSFPAFVAGERTRRTSPQLGRPEPTCNPKHQ